MTVGILEELPSWFMNEDEWENFALCRQAPYVYERDFYAERNVEEWQRCADVCNMCPVRMKCLEVALAAREIHGIWGGFLFAEDGYRRIPPRHERLIKGKTKKSIPCRRFPQL